MPDIQRADCCIVGGGPAGAILALLLARQGVSVALLEAHGDFNREFRGDAIHPSTLELMAQLGVLEELLHIEHTRAQVLTVHTPGGTHPYLNFSGLRSAYPYALRMAQPHFLEFVTCQANQYPAFSLLMRARVEALVEEAGVVRGVRYRTPDGCREMRAEVVIGADGRFSRVRDLAQLPHKQTTQPIDILWFQLPAQSSDPTTEGGLYVGNGGLTFIRYRGTAWQIAVLIPKGTYQHVKQIGLDAVRRAVGERVPWLADRTALLEDWTQTSLLPVHSGSAPRWHRPGVLLIGDAAHVASPVGGVGINLAIQDAVVAANILSGPLKRGEVRPRDLAAVQRRRHVAVRLTQTLQDLFLQYALSAGGTPVRHALRARLAENNAIVRRLRTRLFAFGGFRPERIAEGGR